MNLYLSDEKAKMWRKNGTAKDPKHTASSVKYGGGDVMAWACMPVCGTGPLNFTDDLMYDDQCWGKLLLKVMQYNIALLPKKVTNYVT